MTRTSLTSIFLTLALLVLLASCSQQPEVAVPDDPRTALLSGAAMSGDHVCSVVYAHGKDSIPLIAGIEGDADHADIGLALVQGRRFARCRAEADSIVCEPAFACESSRIRRAAEASATLTLCALGLKAGEKPTLPEGWVCQRGQDGAWNFRNGASGERITVSFADLGDAQ